MLDIKLPQAVEIGFKLLRTEILSWLADEFPLLCLRILFLTSVFLGTGLCAVFLFIQGDTFWGTLVVIFKMLFLCGSTFFMYSILFDWIRPFRNARNMLPKDVKVLPPSAPKPDMDADKNFRRIKDVDELRDGDIVCVELLGNSQLKKDDRNFLCISKQRNIETHSYGVARYAGFKVVIDSLSDWIQHPREWKRFCFQVSFDQRNKLILKSVETNTYLFMMGVVKKILVAWSDRSSFMHRNPTSWERWELHPHLESDLSRHMMFLLYFCFDSKYLKYMDENKCFEISNKAHKAAKFALWKPVLVEDQHDAAATSSISPFNKMG